MKLLICSDIHGSLKGARAVTDAFEREGCDKILALGDLLYHGPRNDLPEEYNPKAVISLLNSYKDKILAVRGNCDTEVDQMVLEFPILADYAYLNIDGKVIFATHGHKFGKDNPPPLNKGEALLCGHTHIAVAERLGEDNLYLNPGSVSIPKCEYGPTYAVLENARFTLKRLDGRAIFTINL